MRNNLKEFQGGQLDGISVERQVIIEIMRKTVYITIAILILPGMLLAQWRGPARNGHFEGEGLLDKWPEGGPELVLSVEGIGEGFSSPVEHNGNIYVTGKIDTMDYLTCIGTQGNIKWQALYGRSWIRTYAHSRSSACLEDNRAYVFSGTGRLACIDAGTGEEIWSANVDEDYGAEWHRWGLSETPLIVDDLVISCPAGKQTSMVAYNKMNGEPVWQTRPVGGQRSYVSAVLYEYRDIRLILGMTSKALFAVNPTDGEVVWSYDYYLEGEKHRETGAIMTNTPVFREDEIFITTGYDYPGIVIKLSGDGRSFTEKWRSKTLDNHHGHVVLKGDYLFGANWHDNRMGDWVCLDWETGEEKWVYNWFCKGSIISAGDRLYIYEEKSGNVGLLKPDPAGFELEGTFQVTVGEGPHWSHPAIYNGRLMIRHGDFLQVYDISE